MKLNDVCLFVSTILHNEYITISGLNWFNLYWLIYPWYVVVLRQRRWHWCHLWTIPLATGLIIDMLHLAHMHNTLVYMHMKYF